MLTKEKKRRKLENCQQKPFHSTQIAIEKVSEIKLEKVLENVVSDHDERWVSMKLEKNRKIYDSQYAKMVEKYLNMSVNSQTIRNLLQKYTLTNRIARQKPRVSKVNKQKRLHFPEKSQQGLTFIDEANKFNMIGSDIPGTKMTKLINELKNFRATVKHEEDLLWFGVL